MSERRSVILAALAGAGTALAVVILGLREYFRPYPWPLDPPIRLTDDTDG